MQGLILREKEMERTISELQISGRLIQPGQTGTTFFTGDECGAPLYLCLGDPVCTGAFPSNEDQEATLATASTSYPALEDVPEGPPAYSAEEVVATSDDSETDSEQWAQEDVDDPYPEEHVAACRAEAENNPMAAAKIWWTARRWERRKRAAFSKPGQFGPKRRMKVRKIAKRFTRRAGGASAHSKPKRGFYIGQHFVSFEGIPEDQLQAFFS